MCGTNGTERTDFVGVETKATKRVIVLEFRPFPSVGFVSHIS